MSMTQPNEQVEMIKRVMDDRQRNGFVGPDDGIIRALLEENKRLTEFLKEEQQDLADLHEEYQKECADLQRAKEELERLKTPIAGHPTPEEIKDMLIHFAPTPVQKIAEHFEAVLLELSQARSELSAKDKVLEWYADTDTHEIKRRELGDFAPIVLDKGYKAQSILSQYKGEKDG